MSVFERLAILATEKLVRHKDREFLTGDLVEEFDRRKRGRDTAGSAWWWLFRQVLHVFGQQLRPDWNKGQEGMKRNQSREGTSERSPLLVGAPGALAADLRLGARTIRRRGMSSLLIAVTLGIGIGFTTLVYMFADAVLLQPLDYQDPETLAVIQVRTGDFWHGTSEPGLFDLRELDSLSSVAGWTTGARTMLAQPESRRLLTVRASANLLETLGVEPALGRFFDQEEDLPGAPGVVVISHSFWQNQLGGDQEAIGSSLLLDGEAHDVIGILPAGFRYPSPRFDLFLPLAIDPDDLWGRNNHYLNVIARLAPQVSLHEARVAVETLGAQTEQAYPEFYGENGHQTRLQSSSEAFLGGARRPVFLIVAAVAALLLLTCANVANLQIWRAAERGRELEIRKTLGARTARLIAQLLTETLILSTAGATLGLAIALVGVRWLPVLLPEGLPRADQMRFEPRALVVIVLLTLFATLASGLWPALRSATRAGRLATRSQIGHLRASFLRRGLVVGQVALAVLLLFGCSLMIRSLQELTDIDPGFDPNGVLVFDLTLPEQSYDTPEKTVAYFRDAEKTLAELPGIAAAGGILQLPLTGGGNDWSIEIEGRPVANVGEAPAESVQQVTPGYFEALRIQLLEGRLPTAQDTADSPGVVIVNQAMARKFWPGASPVGKRLRVFDEGAPWMTVVGVVGDVLFDGLDREARPRWYVPHEQAHLTAYYSPRNLTFAVRARSEDAFSSDSEPSADAVAGVLAALRDLDPNVPIVSVEPFSDIVHDSLALPRQLAAWLALFAGVAISLAVLGLYGVLSSSVSTRYKEIGVRMALGATPGAILRRITGEGMTLVIAGWLLGLISAIFASRLITSMLVGVAPTDLQAIVVVSLLLAAVALIASLVPARRASNLDPQHCLRND